MSDETDKWRQQRMQDLSTKYDGNAPLGRALGYKDGAYVRQMIAGERAISEKTVKKAEKLPGCAGWFSQQAGGRVPPPAAPAPGFRDNHTLSPEQWEMFQAFSIAATSDEKKAILERYESLKKIAAQVYGANQGEKK